jgi:polyhydroxybutyrate depolymerase
LVSGPVHDEPALPRRRCLALILAAVALGSCIPFGGATPLDRASLRPGDAFHKIRVGDRLRNYLLHVPPDGAGGPPIPLVIVIHGTRSTATLMPKSTRMSEAADRRRFDVAYPMGTGSFPFAFHTWHTGRCCGYALDARVKDVDYIHALVLELVSKANVDPDRVFVTGFSDGAMMTFRLGCDLGGEIAAIAPVGGRMPDLTCRPARPMPVIAFGGTDDDQLANDHDRYTDERSRPYAFSLGASIDFWAKEDRCSRGPEHSRVGRHDRIAYRGCAAGSDVVLYWVKGGRHAWPGGRRSWLFSAKPANDLDATELILDFFNRHPRPAADPLARAGLPRP